MHDTDDDDRRRDTEPLPMEKFINAIRVLPNSCWQWQNSLATFGYGKFWIGNTQFMAHRFAWWVFRGAIPKGLQIDHLCRNRGCVNPDHMEPVTIKENVLRGVGTSAINKRKTHCKNGHAYDRISPSNRRYCSICKREWRRDRDKLKVMVV